MLFCLLSWACTLDHNFTNLEDWRWRYAVIRCLSLSLCVGVLVTQVRSSWRFLEIIPVTIWALNKLGIFLVNIHLSSVQCQKFGWPAARADLARLSDLEQNQLKKYCVIWCQVAVKNFEDLKWRVGKERKIGQESQKSFGRYLRYPKKTSV